jgi:hypothetical protein
MKKDNCKLDGAFDVLVVMTPILLIAIPLIIREIVLIVG